MNPGEYITPSVMVDGETVPLEGWMFILACAMKGIPWAVKKALDPAFDLRGKMLNYHNQKEAAILEAYIKRIEADLIKAKDDLCKLNK